MSLKYPLIFVVVAITTLFSGCSHTPIPVIVQKPVWFYTPSQAGGVGGVGISGTHIKGPFAQRELAISRAVDEIARQMGVNVQNVLKTSAEVSGSSVKTSLETYSIQTSDGKIVKASVREIWIDPVSNELYVWMIAK